MQRKFAEENQSKIDYLTELGKGFIGSLRIAVY